SHKLGEVLEVCDEVVVLRDGAVAGRARAADTDRAKLARMMVDRDVSAPVAREDGGAGAERLVVGDLAPNDVPGVERLGGVSFSVRSGEVLAIAGVDGNGQAELVDVIAGLRRPTRGHVFVDGADVTVRGVTGRRQAGLAHVPADRHTTGLVADMTVTENLAFRDCDGPPFRRGPWLDFAAMRAAATERIARFGIRVGGPEVPARTLSGGNQQKLVLARELTRRPRVLVAAQPTRGLDPGATRYVIDEVLALRASGGAVLYVSTELEEALVVADRIAVMYRGRFPGVGRPHALDLPRPRPPTPPPCTGKECRDGPGAGSRRRPGVATARRPRRPAWAGAAAARRAAGVRRHRGPDRRGRQESTARLLVAGPRGLRLVGPHRRRPEPGHALRPHRGRHRVVLPRARHQHRRRGAAGARRPGGDVGRAPHGAGAASDRHALRARRRRAGRRGLGRAGRRHPPQARRPRGPRHP